MWNFKGYLWNSTQKILPICWKILFLCNIHILRALRFKSWYAFLNIYPITAMKHEGHGIPNIFNNNLTANSLFRQTTMTTNIYALQRWSLLWESNSHRLFQPQRDILKVFLGHDMMSVHDISWSKGLDTKLTYLQCIHSEDTIELNNQYDSSENMKKKRNPFRLS